VILDIQFVRGAANVAAPNRASPIAANDLMVRASFAALKFWMTVVGTPPAWAAETATRIEVEIAIFFMTGG